jgi:hypothetical protein
MFFRSAAFFAASIFFPLAAVAQSVQFSPNADTSHHARLSLEGYVDTYFGFDFNQPKDANRPYFVSQGRHNEFNVNLAYLSAKYSSERARATLTPGFGTYMNANYAAERVTLRHLLEANVGVKLSKKRSIWLDVGVIGSPYTNETALSLDQPTLSRSFAPEYVPYFLTGAKLALPLGSKTTLTLYYLNGWQVIEDVNTPLSFGTQIEHKPSAKWTLNWNTFVGNENSASAPTYQMRYFSDLYALWNPTARLSLTACVYGGIQERRDNGSVRHSRWWQANAAARYALRGKGSVSARLERFSDPESVMILPVTAAAGVNGFDCNSLSLGYNLHLTKQAAFRFEGRHFWSGRRVFLNDNLQPTSRDFLLIGGLTARF